MKYGGLFILVHASFELFSVMVSRIDLMFSMCIDLHL